MFNQFYLIKSLLHFIPSSQKNVRIPIKYNNLYYIDKIHKRIKKLYGYEFNRIVILMKTYEYHILLMYGMYFELPLR